MSGRSPAAAGEAWRTGTIVALVPMRHHSERVPEKNYREMAGQPLYAHILNVLQGCPELDRIVVDTDSPVIRKGITQRFPKIQILERPPELRGDNVPMNEILVYDASQVPADLYLQTHSTNPLLRPETISRALHALRSSREHDSLFSVTRLQERLWTAGGDAVNHDPELLVRTQDLPATYLENSCLYLVGREVLLARKNRIGRHPLLFPIDPAEAWDIDEELDMQIAECLLQARSRPASPPAET